MALYGLWWRWQGKRDDRREEARLKALRDAGHLKDGKVGGEKTELDNRGTYQVAGEVGRGAGL